MQKEFVKYYLTLFILLFSGYSYLSATSSSLTGSRDTRVNGEHRYRDFSFNASLSTSHKIDFDNMENTYNLKVQEVEALTQSIDISNNLFRSAADYMESVVNTTRCTGIKI